MFHATITHTVKPHDVTDAEGWFDSCYDALHWCDVAFDGARKAYPTTVDYYTCGIKDYMSVDGQFTAFMHFEVWDERKHVTLGSRTFMVPEADVERLRHMEPIEVEDLPGMREDAEYHAHP